MNVHVIPKECHFFYNSEKENHLDLCVEQRVCVSDYLSCRTPNNKEELIFISGPTKHIELKGFFLIFSGDINKSDFGNLWFWSFNLRVLKRGMIFRRYLALLFS